MNNAWDADALVVGAGASGLAAALAAASAGARVRVLESLDAPGRRLCASGGGRGNFGNTDPPERLAAAFGRAGRFVKPAFAALARGRGGVAAWLDSLGVASSAADGFHYFPLSGRASDLRDRLRDRAAGQGVVFHSRARVDRIAREAPGGGFRVLAGQTAWRSPVCVLACGGQSRPELGGCRDGYDFARAFGHAVVEPVPALCGLKTAGAWPASLAGISLETVRVGWEALSPPSGRSAADGPEEAFPPAAARAKPMSFTHAGVSGPAVLDVSGAVNAFRARGGEAGLLIDFTPGIDERAWRGRWDAKRARAGKSRAAAVLREVLPAALSEALAVLAGVGERRLGELTREGREALTAAVKQCRLPVAGSEGWDRAMAARGGAARDGVNPRTLESRRIPGLFFAGELLDVDGPCGGYNLAWAFASGLAAGAAAAASAARPSPAAC